MRGKRAAAAALGLTGILAGCSSGSGGLSGIGGFGPANLSYQASNAITKAGYKEEQLAPDRYRITVTGYSHTPRERLEKIAQTRAAEIGDENRLGSFRLENLAVTTRCEKFTSGVEKGASGGQKRAELYTVLTAEAAYAKNPPDASYVNARQVLPQLKADLEAQAFPPVPADPVAQSQCTNT
jgi:hypothetical protein